MKLSKYAKLVKEGGYCSVIHAEDSGIWLGTRAALFRATAPSQGRRPCSGFSSPAWAHRARNTSAVSSSTSSRAPCPASTRTTTALT